MVNAWPKKTRLTNTATICSAMLRKFKNHLHIFAEHTRYANKREIGSISPAILNFTGYMSVMLSKYKTGEFVYKMCVILQRQMIQIAIQ